MFEPLTAGAIDKRRIWRDFTYGFHVVVLIEFKQSYFFTIAFARETERIAYELTRTVGIKAVSFNETKRAGIRSNSQIACSFVFVKLP